MGTLPAAKLLQIYGIVSISAFAVAYAFASSKFVYVLLLVAVVVGFFSVLSLLISFSIGKYVLSVIVDVVRFLLRLPFKVIRALPRLIRLLFFEGPVVITFFLWFRILVSFDRHVLRRALYWAGGTRHASGVKLSTVNSIAPAFEPISSLGSRDIDGFDVKAALSLSNLCRMVYEDEAVVKYELEKAGFRSDSTQIIQYHNTNGFISQRKDVVVIAFRGTEPLNLMHILTDLKGGLTSLASLDDVDVNAGRVHYGFLEALRLHRKDTPKQSENEKKETTTLQLNEDDTVGSVFAALFKISSFLFHSTKSYALQPISLTLPRSNGQRTAFEQINDALEKITEHSPISRIYITGHSLGGALATVFFAQSLMSSVSKPFVDRMEVYSFGAPRLGDAAFTEWMTKIGASDRIYKVVHAQDLVPRQPTLPQHLPKALRHLPYADSPGILVHLHPLRESQGSIEEMPGLTIQPNGAIPSIEFWGLTGILSPETIYLIRTEPWLWVIARIFIPFVMFDHLASEYSRVLGEIWHKSDEGHFESQVDDNKPLKNKLMQ